MIFIETPVFLSDDQYARLQSEPITRPDAGDLIRGGRGIRRLRWRVPGGGKSGGIRVIYFWRVSASQILLLTLYSKGEQTNLTPAQVKHLARYVEAQK